MNNGIKKTVSKNMKYEERVVVFLDILDFSNIIKNSTSKNSKLKVTQLAEIFNGISEAFNIGQKKYWDISSKQATHFSDSIVISYKADEIEEIIGAIVDIQHLITTLVKHKILLRGAIAKGKFIHNDEMLFGPALVEAYEMETKAAIYPRVVLEKKLVKHLLLPELTKSLQRKLKFRLIDLITKDQDGLYYINYFFNLGAFIIEADGMSKMKFNYLSYLVSLKSIIEKSIEHKSPGVRIKYQWMREKFNEFINKLKEPRYKNLIQGAMEQNDYREILKLGKIN